MKIKFYLALWLGKIYLFFLKLLKQEKDDKPGLLCLKIDNNFLDEIKKPKTVIAITGTNGKTTVSNMLAEILIKDNKKVVYNDWGANTRASVTRCLLDSVNIFNKTVVDIAVLETDEITSNDIFPLVKPNYIVVTNLFRDSMHRNANPDYVFDKINNFIPKDSTLILNADDIISSNLGPNNKKVLYSIEKQKWEKEQKNIVIDKRICPICHNELKYEFRRYHHIGKVHCPVCHFKSLTPNYIATKINLQKETITVNHKDEKTEYKLSNDSIFNAYNTLATITTLRTMGINNNKIIDYLKNQTIVKSRYSSTKINNIEINTIAAKGLNGVAVSHVCNYLSNIKGNIEIIIVIDDTFDNKGGSEAIAWIYDADFEFLNQENIKKIIVGGKRNRDYHLRLLLGGIKEEKIVCVENEQDTYKYLSFNNIDKIFILHEVYYITGARKIKENIIKKIKEDNNAN